MTFDRRKARNDDPERLGHLLARPVSPNETTFTAGLHPLELDGTRDGLCYVPASSEPDRPLVVMLHGAGSTAQNGLAPLLPLDRCSRVIVPRLEREGYEVRYHEFNGIHTVPRAITGEAVSWFLGKHDNKSA